MPIVTICLVLEKLDCKRTWLASVQITPLANEGQSRQEHEETKITDDLWIWTSLITKLNRLQTRMYSSRMHTAHSISYRGGGGLPQCMLGYTPWVWAWRTPPGVGLAWKPPEARPLNFPPGCGPGNLQGMLGYHHPWDLLQGMLGYHLQYMLGYHPPVDRMTDMCKNITFANFVCGQ